MIDFNTVLCPQVATNDAGMSDHLGIQLIVEGCSNGNTNSCRMLQMREPVSEGVYPKNMEHKDEN